MTNHYSAAEFALMTLLALPADVRKVIGHAYDDDGLQHDQETRETIYSPLMRVLCSALDGSEIIASDYDSACDQVQTITKRACGALEAIRTFGVAIGQSYPELRTHLSAARTLGITTGPLDFMFPIEGGATNADIEQVRCALCEPYR